MNMMPPDSLADLGQDFANRFSELLKTAGANAKPIEPALLPAAGAKSQLTCEGYMGGKDVEIVLVLAKRDVAGKALAVKETLTYRRDIASSDLVYDLTGEFMQGKARPFDCDLRRQPARLYALMPFQIEQLQVAVNTRISKPSKAGSIDICLEYLNGLGKPASGTLPCHVELRTPDERSIWQRFLATSLDGTLSKTIDFPPSPRGMWSLVVRSLLDGHQTTTSLLRPK